MGSAYTPGLTVSDNTVVQRIRRLPIKGEVTVGKGDTVSHDTIIAKAYLPGLLQTVKLAERLGVEAKDAPGMSAFKEGDEINEGDLIAETKGFFGLFKSEVKSGYTGTVESLSEVTGNMLVREAPIPVELSAYIDGKIVDVMPEEGVIVETRGAMVQGIFGVGGERNGEVVVAVGGPDEVLEDSHITAEHKGKIVVGGAGVTLEALRKAQEVEATGVIVGAIKDSDLQELLGYDIGVAITGQEKIGITIVVTEGFGRLAMANRTFDLFKSLEGRQASVNGATQIRAGVIRPEMISPDPSLAGDKEVAEGGGALTNGTQIRVIREPYFGMIGTVTDLPAQLHTVDSGAEVRVLQAKLADGREVLVPRANVEIIAS